MVEPLRHRQTKGAETDMLSLTSPRHISTLPTDPNHAPHSRSSLTFARSSPLVIFLPITAIRGLKLHPQPQRPVRDPQIPIASRSYRAPLFPRFPPCEAFERRPPAARPTVVQGARVRNPVEDANQMASFQPMLDLASEFVALGVRFQRPILNCTTLWSLGGD